MQKKTKILYDARGMLAGISGIPEYTRLLLINMASLNTNDEFSIFLNSFKKNKIPDDVEKIGNVINWRIPNRIMELSSRFGGFSNFGKLSPFDVVFRPHFHPLGKSKNNKEIVVIHDLSFETMPNLFSKKNLLWHWIVDPKGQAKRAEKIIAVSEATKKDIVDRYGIFPEKISVVYPGINPFFSESVEDLEIAKFKAQYGIQSPFLLFVGTIEPRKNIIGAIKIFEILKERFSDLSLILAGSCGKSSGPILKFAEKSKYAKDIKFWGFASFPDLRNLYHSATLFLYPSFLEGFGMPPLEAQASGLPVISSNAGALQETLENSAILLNPEDVAGFASAVERILTDSDMRKRLIKEGKENVVKFSWKNSAKEVLEIIHNI